MWRIIVNSQGDDIEVRPGNDLAVLQGNTPIFSHRAAGKSQARAITKSIWKASMQLEFIREKLAPLSKGLSF